MVDGIKRLGHKSSEVLADLDDLPEMIAQRAGDGDYVICLGAGSISSWAYALPEQLDKVIASQKKQSA